MDTATGWKKTNVRIASERQTSFVSHVISLLLSLKFGACTAGVPFPLAMRYFCSFVSHVISFLLSSRFGACTAGVHSFVSLLAPFSAGGATFLFMCLPGLSLAVSPLLCNISIHLFPSSSVTVGVRPFPLATQHHYSLVSEACHWWCPPFSADHVAFLFICLPHLSLLVSALFRWLFLPRRSVTAGVRPFLLAM